MTRKLFVVMPFGVRTSVQGNSTSSIDFDAVYSHLIRPSALDAGWEVTRIDEVVQPGPIADAYLKEIYFADLVLADVSIANANVFYELGLRHAISTGGTLLVALTGTQLPFDISHLRVIFYQFGDERELQPAKRLLTQALLEYDPVGAPSVNPIRRFLEGLGAATSPSLSDAAFEQELHGRISRARNVDQTIAIWQWAQNLSPLPALALLSLADRLGDYEAWHTSVEVLRAALAARPKDFEIHRALGWHLRHLGSDFDQEATASLERAIELNPGDPESIGMLAGILKRRGDHEGAANLYRLGVKFSPDSLYMRVNEAAMTILTQPNDFAAGVKLYRRLYEGLSANPHRESDAWTELVLGEAAFALGEIEVAKQHFVRAATLPHSPKDLRSAADQLEILSKAGFMRTDGNQLSTFIRGLASPEQAVATTARSSLRSPKTPVIIHLSDIHFGTREVNGKRAAMHRFFDGEYEKNLSWHIASEFVSGRKHFELDPERLLLVVSGDLTYTAERNEFQQVHDFLTEVCSTLKIEKSQVFLVPGNHDVHWASAQIDLSYRFDNYLSFLLNFYGPELFRTRYPKITWDFHVNSPRPRPGEILAFYRQSGLTVVGLNSCVYETSQDHYGFVGGRQMDIASDLIEEVGTTERDLRIAVMHHHLHPFPEPMTRSSESQVWMDVSTIRDAGLVERRLERLGFDMVLHGHKHKPQLRETLVRDRSEPKAGAARLIVCGAGSTGVNAKELEHNYSNHYEVIEVLRQPRVRGTDFLSIEWRELSLIPGSEWLTSERWIVLG